MMCPVCKVETNKLIQGGFCPNCRAPLSLVKRFDGDKEIEEYVVRRSNAGKNGEVEEFKTVFDDGSVKLEKSNKNNFILTFDRIMSYNWIYCPSCESKMFQNNIVKGSLEHKCHKCKSVTTYIFK